MKEVIEEFNRILAKCKSTFESRIKDKTLSLDERWELFLAAPSCWKNHEPWIVHFEFEKSSGEISWYDDFYAERYTVVTMDNDLVDRFLVDERLCLFVVSLKEEVLENNLGSFTFDW